LFTDASLGVNDEGLRRVIRRVELGRGIRDNFESFSSRRVFIV
jgi:hypothetical protein